MSKQIEGIDKLLTKINEIRIAKKWDKIGIATTVSSTGKISPRYKACYIKSELPKSDDFFYKTNTLKQLHQLLRFIYSGLESLKEKSKHE